MSSLLTTFTPTSTIRRQSGVIPYRFGQDRIPEVLLITAPNSGCWGIPAGCVDAGLTEPESAASIAAQQAGVFGFAMRLCLGSFVDDDLDHPFRVRLFAMRITHELKSWPEMDRRKRTWVRPDQAAMMVDHPDLALCIERIDAFIMCRGRSLAAA